MIEHEAYLASLYYFNRRWEKRRKKGHSYSKMMGDLKVMLGYGRFAKHAGYDEMREAVAASLQKYGIEDGRKPVVREITRIQTWK